MNKEVLKTHIYALELQKESLSVLINDLKFKLKELEKEEDVQQGNPG